MGAHSSASPCFAFLSLPLTCKDQQKGGKPPGRAGTSDALFFLAAGVGQPHRDLKAADGKGAVYLPRVAGLCRARGHVAWPSGSSCDEKRYGEIKVLWQVGRSRLELRVSKPRMEQAGGCARAVPIWGSCPASLPDPGAVKLGVG